MRVARVWLITLLAAVAGAVAPAAPRAGGATYNPQTAPTSCPMVMVSAPTEFPMTGAPVTFSANITGGEQNVKPTYNWTVSAGTIISGQGTGSITVDTAGLPTYCPEIIATVVVGGYEPSCTMSASRSNMVCCLNTPRKADEYGGGSGLDDEKAHLSYFSNELQNDPTAQGYLICYGGRRSTPGEAQRRCDRARNYLANTRGISADLIVTVDSGYREEPTVELWVVPSGATPPPPSPTVDPSEVRPPRPPRVVRRRGRR